MRADSTLMWAMLAAAFALGCGDHQQNVLRPSSLTSTFQVQGRFLQDSCGERVALRGVNEMVLWGDAHGNVTFPQVALTNANAVRLSWSAKGSAADLDAVLSNAVAHQLIPMPEFHEYVADTAGLNTIVDYWTQPAIAAVLRKHQQHTLLNLSAGMGSNTVSDDDWAAAQVSAIGRIRAAGIHVPLGINAPNWGNRISTLAAKGPDLVEQDPDHNLLLGVQMWWPAANGYSAQSVSDAFASAVAANLPLFVAEFSSVGPGPDCLPGVPYAAIIQGAQAQQVGWFAWSWGTVPNSDCSELDMTTGGTFSTLHGWGLEVATTSPYGISNTSVRPRSMVAGTCD